MSEPEDKTGKSAKTDVERDGSNGEDREEALAAGDGLSSPEGIEIEGEVDGVPQLKMSDELERALKEATESMDKVQTSPSDSDEAEGEEVEVEVDLAEEEFDPNAVEESEEGPPPQPSKRELELKMEILGLRQELRAKDLDLEKRTREVKQNLDQARHLQNQFDGYKIRVQKEKADWFNYGHEPLLKEILPVVDNLERALGHAGDEADLGALREGVELTLKQFLSALEKFGVKKIKTLGEPFNPEVHQAMSQIADDSVPNNTVLEVYQQGYTLKDRLLRPSLAIVSKGSGKAQPSAAAEEGRGGDESPEERGDESDKDNVGD